MTHRLPRLIAPLAALALALTACTAGAGTAPAPTATGGSTAAGGPSTDKITLGLVAEPASLDFTKTDGAAIPQALLVNVYEGLVKLDQDGKIVPALATSWKGSDDHKTYTFELPPGAKFTNGAAFTSDDAVFSINRVKTDWTTSLKAAMDVVTEAKALSPTQLQVTLAAPSNDWLYRMTTHLGAMFSKTGVDDLANKPIGTGPYTFTSWNRGDSITLTRNESYWGTKPFYQSVVLKYFKDATALNNALLTGTINVVTTVQAPEALGQFTSNPKYQVIEGTTNGEVLLSFNNKNDIFKDKRVRQAIRYGIGVGREGFTWSGVQTITRKAEWPNWTPPAEMIARQPYLPRYMAGGPGNPLGARAMYLGGTIYRIHGTNAPGSVGGFVSYGCIRMLNIEVSELYENVSIGTKVIVL